MIEFFLKFLKLQSHFGQVFDLIGDMLILWLTYKKSRQPENIGNTNYLIGMAVNLICAFSTFLIGYSSMLNMALSERLYEPQSMEKASGIQKILRFIFLSFIGPLFPIFIQCLSFIEYIFLILLMIVWRNRIVNYEKWWTEFYKKYFGLSKRQMEGLEAQQLIAQLLFESLPMLILKLLIIYGSLEIKLGEHDHSKEEMIIIVSACVTVLNMLNTFLKIWVESRALKEPFILYVLNSLKSQHEWIPFNHMFKKCEPLGLTQDYSQIKIKYPILTDITGFYQNMEFQFEATSLQEFSTQIVLYSNHLLTNGMLEKQDSPPIIDTHKNLDVDLQKSQIKSIPNQILNKLKEQFDKLDSDNDGLIQRQQLLEYIKNQLDQECNSNQINDSIDIKKDMQKILDLLDQQQTNIFDFNLFVSLVAMNSDQDNEIQKDYDFDQMQVETHEDLEKDVVYRIVDNINIGKSIDSISINLAVHTYDITRLPGINLNFHEIDWRQLMLNSYKLKTINISQRNKRKLEAFTTSGKPCIWVCVDHEPTEMQKRQKQSFELEECMKILLYHKIETDIVDSYGETLLIHAIKTFKEISIDLLIKYGTSIYKANNFGMTPLGQSIKDNRLQLAENLIEIGSSLHEKCIYDAKISTKLCSPIEYLAKKMKIDKDFNNNGQSVKLIELFARMRMKAAIIDEKLAIFEYVAESFNQPIFPFHQTKLLVSKLFKKLDILQIKDQKGKNFVHLLVKNWTDKSTESNLKDHLQTFTKNKQSFGKLVWTEDNTGVSPISALMKSQKYENNVHMTYV